MTSHHRRTYGPEKEVDYDRRGGGEGFARTTSNSAMRTTRLIEALARSLFTTGHGTDPPGGADIQGAVRLCVRILTSHIGEPLMLGDEACITQVLSAKMMTVRLDT